METEKELAALIYGLCRKIREKRPLIHVVTNFVVMNQTANALLALGAAPTMSWAKEDLEYISRISDGLCVNMGTPTRERVAAMTMLMELAGTAGKPLVLDPVGAGAGPHRTGIARRLSALAPQKIIRGNASEICSLTHDHASPRGVDNTLSPAHAKKILIAHGRADGKGSGSGMDPRGAALLSDRAACLLVSGKEDMVLAASRGVILKNGSDLMSAVTGTGCILSAITAAFYAVSSDPFEAALAACAVSAVAGELAAQKAGGPGTFLSHFMDALYTLDQKTLKARLKVEILSDTPYPGPSIIKTPKNKETKDGKY